jgi:hypothetical protein
MRRTESLVAIKGLDLEYLEPVRDHSNNDDNDNNSTPIMQRVSSKSCLKSEASNSSTSLSNLKRNVSFHQIEINQFSVEIGDNPCAVGVPIQIGWTPNQTDVLDLELYESSKPEPRDRHEFHMPPQIRHALLFTNGVHPKDMRNAIREGEKIKKSRERSIQSQKWDGLHYTLETARRRLKKVTSSPSLFTSRRKQLKRVASVPSLMSARTMHDQHASLSPHSRSYRALEVDGPITF